MKTITQEQLNKKLADHKVWVKTRYDKKPKGKQASFLYVEFSKLCFAGAILEEAKFEGCKLDGCDLNSVYAKRVEFRSTQFSRCSFRDAYLELAKFKYANMWWVNLDGANLTSADFTGARASYISIRNVVLKYANLWWAEFYDFQATPEVWDAVIALRGAMLAFEKTSINQTGGYEI